MKGLSFLIFLAGFISRGEGISCYQCLNFRGVTPDMTFPAFGYGPGCEADSLSTAFIAPCVVSDPEDPPLDACLNVEMVLDNNITIIARTCANLEQLGGAKCAVSDEFVRDGLWLALKLYERFFFENPVLPERAPAGIPMNLCSCKGDDCNGNCTCGGIGDPDPSTSPPPEASFAGKGVTKSEVLVFSAMIISLARMLYSNL
ncbi:uncharacterized protein LOC110856612 [Folsomia candida]|uniref:Protein sleepless n=1 Tax=Folsomia candida TaxID=158441 RepID=A0A226DLN9_FOLCA|nr:uncharacterized protein LOC110856612 [Folsomia candida]OXA46099.1 hypothetical protein Fcan01_18987 [Folsomia candida]